MTVLLKSEKTREAKRIHSLKRNVGFEIFQNHSYREKVFKPITNIARVNKIDVLRNHYDNFLYLAFGGYIICKNCLLPCWNQLIFLQHATVPLSVRVHFERI